jgi:hypothetical protein
MKYTRRTSKQEKNRQQRKTPEKTQKPEERLHQTYNKSFLKFTSILQVMLSLIQQSLHQNFIVCVGLPQPKKYI